MDVPSFYKRLVLMAACCCLAPPTGARGDLPGDLQTQFAQTVRPFVERYCVDCHSGDAPEAELNLETFAAAIDDQARMPVWELVSQRLAAGEMPPEGADQPTDDERREVVKWIAALRTYHAQQNAGDPGRVLVRRLSNAEFDYSIRDLTGVDIRPASEFPIDPANEAGFDNSGESLSMTPALLSKYLQAARRVADHLVLKPHGFDFAPHPVVTDTDRDKYCVRRIVDFYQQQCTDYALYFLAAWRFHHRDALGLDAQQLSDIAGDSGISPKYLETIWTLLTQTPDAVGPIARVQEAWNALPDPSHADDQQILVRCQEIRDEVIDLRGKLAMEFPKLRVRGMHAGSQPLVLWRNRQYAANRRTLNRQALRMEGDPAASDPALTLPADDALRARYEAAFEQFCSVFPDKFYVSERGREFLDRDADEIRAEEGRLLSAGFHSMMGFFRDDQPLYELLLDEQQKQQLDELWRELDFITRAPMRQHSGFIWFERTDSRFMISPEFDFARAEDKDAASPEKIRQLAEVYLAKAERQGAEEVELAAIGDHFQRINDSIQWVVSARRLAEPSHLEALLRFAERAVRRPLAQTERDELLDFYHRLRDEGEMDHEEAMRDTLVSVLMSPHFCYRLDLAGAGDKVQPLSDYALASRLSYFLWSSAPDERLLDRAAAGELHRPEVIADEARRMLRDSRIRGLATEFAGNWLDFRQFQQHNSVDRERFSTFTPQLRDAMFEEPVRFFMDVVQNDRSVLDFLYADYTFVNSVLAEHYGMPTTGLDADRWVQVDRAGEYGRGGLLPMAVFLTKNAPGLRTSPVKRGYWVVRRILGERIPPPPPDVPELPSDESQLGELTLREVLARHREDHRCAACHERFDSIGLVFEGFGPIGERRTVDLGGRPVQTHAAFPGGMEGEGLEGLRQYLHQNREEEFLDNLCSKLLSYALGRSLLPSDDAIRLEMRARLESNGYRLSDVVQCIVTSPQFLTQRGEDLLTRESE